MPAISDERPGRTLDELGTIALEVADASTRAYLDSLDRVVALQRDFLATTPFAPLGSVLDAQADIARGVLAPGVWGVRPPASGDDATDDAPTPSSALAEAAKQTTRPTARARKAAKETRDRARTATKKQSGGSATQRRRGPKPPLTGFADLTADELNAKLAGLSQRELGEVAAYERAHAARSTVLDRVTALQEAEPAPGYDDLGADDAVRLLSDAPRERAEAVRAYERRHKQRATVLQAAERRIENA